MSGQEASVVSAVDTLRKLDADATTSGWSVDDIPVLRNALPELVALVEASQADKVEGCDCDACRRQCDCVRCLAMRKALAALEAKLAEAAS